MSWKGMTKEEKKAQITGFAIDCGNVGYLRASIGMKRESLVLRGIFPERMWAHGKCHGYDEDKRGANLCL